MINWISVTERLPTSVKGQKEARKLLMLFREGEIATGYYWPHYDAWDYSLPFSRREVDGYVTHWAEVPDHPNA